jgi:hypothetical protein
MENVKELQLQRCELWFEGLEFVPIGPEGVDLNVFKKIEDTGGGGSGAIAGFGIQRKFWDVRISHALAQFTLDEGMNGQGKIFEEEERLEAVDVMEKGWNDL